MDAYTLLERIGAGTFSTVFRARENATGRIVAVKELTDASITWDAVQRMPEVLASRVIPPHENVLRLDAVHRLGGRVFLVMDHCTGSLLDALSRRAAAGTPGLSEAEARFVTRRLLLALAHVHAAGHVHRDVKPENVLLAGPAARPVLADFGQIRRVGGADGGCGPLTPYVSTRWYRAPEVLLRSPAYGAKADVWAVGATLIELLSGRPAFPGTSEADQMYRLCAALGTPTAAVWREAPALASAAGVALPPLLPGRDIAALLPPRTSPAAVAAVAAMLAWDPAVRVSAAGALALPFFAHGLTETPVVFSAALNRPAEVASRADAAARQSAIVAELAALAISGAGAGGSSGKEGDSDSDGEGKEAEPSGRAGAGAGATAHGVCAPSATVVDSDSDEGGSQWANGAGARANASARSGATASTVRPGGVSARTAPSFSPQRAANEAGGGKGKESESDADLSDGRSSGGTDPSVSDSDSSGEPGYLPSFS